MNPHWHSFLQSSKAVFSSDTSEVLDFGDASGELLAANGKTVLVPLTHLGLIDVQGEDAKGFLHSQLTSDVNHLTEGKAQYSAWCTAKGRMQASFIAWREKDAYQLALSADLQEAVQKRLQMFVLRAKVKLASLSEQKCLIGLAGPQAQEALSHAGLPVPTVELTSLSGQGGSVIRMADGRFLIVSAAESVADVWQRMAIKATPAGLPVWRWLDIQAGFPLVVAATKEEFVPQMADFEKIGGVSFHKGCYPGQEIVARTQYLGKVKRHLFRLRSEQALHAGEDLHSPDNPDQTCGKVVSVAPSPAGGFEALAVIQSNFAGNIHLGSLDGPLLQATAVNP